MIHTKQPVTFKKEDGKWKWKINAKYFFDLHQTEGLTADVAEDLMNKFMDEFDGLTGHQKLDAISDAWREFARVNKIKDRKLVIK